ncbi:MAG: hypothetical protein DRP71_05820 [Verrucomicrobia bacterium]|nr:MAG: hypothetical protein DRP71_05820 [Verrucomicrobiota bacterium]
MRNESLPDRPETGRTDGGLPVLWDRRVIFVANLLSLFFGNEKETGELMDQVGPLETYGGRLVPVLDLIFRGDEDNVVVLERRPDENLLGYFSRELGLRLPRIRLLSNQSYQNLRNDDPRKDPVIAKLVDGLVGHDDAWLDGFVTDVALERLGELLKLKTISSQRASHCGNNKYLLHQHLANNGLPVFDTWIAGGLSEVADCLHGLRSQGYDRAAIKAQIGASGIGIIRVDTGKPGDIPPFLFFEGPCLVQGWLDASVSGVANVRSPSVQCFLGDGHISLYDLTEQILSPDSVHEGNISPPPWIETEPETVEELYRQAEVAGRWLYLQGYRGTASVDFHVVFREGRPEVRVCEINARVTGATYPSILARHFTPKGAWLMRNLRFEPKAVSSDLLERLDRANILYHPGMSTGILPINFNTDLEGQVCKGQFLCLGPDPETLWGLLTEARDLLAVRGEFDRD